MTAIDGVDHIGIVVHSLDAARNTFERLGFAITPQNRHAGFGTGNRLLLFPGHYIELIAVLDPAFAHTPEQRSIRAALDIGERPVLLALGASDIEVGRRELTDAGLRVQPTQTWSREAVGAAQCTQASFSTARFESDSANCYITFLVQHHTPDAVWDRDFMQHPNGAIGIVKWTLAVPGTRSGFGCLSPFVSDAVAEEQSPEGGRESARPTVSLQAGADRSEVVVAVASLDSLRTRLERQAVAYHTQACKVIVDIDAPRLRIIFVDRRQGS